MPRALRARGARVHLLRLKRVLAAEPSARMPREPRCDRLYGEIGDRSLCDRRLRFQAPYGMFQNKVTELVLPAACRHTRIVAKMAALQRTAVTYSAIVP